MRTHPIGTGSSGPGARGLTVVQIHLLLGAHDDIVAGPRGGDASGVATPGGHGRALRQPALQDLVPADQPAPARGQPRVEVPDEPGLELVLVREAEFPDARLGRRGPPPLLLGAFVAAGVDELRREQLQHFLEDALVKAQGVVSGGEYVRVDSPGVPDGEGGGVDDVGVAEFRVRGDGGLRVAGYVDFGDDGDMPLGGVGDDLPDVVLGVVAAVRLLLPQRRGPVAGFGPRPPGADLRQPGMPLDLDAPTLVVRQM
ncbi:hypothetical protein HDA41_003050 [Streptomyces caelestis]|uniref:Uncharacterized protein n=1 Tax=Streptomyces caelestis TaxID=36816 RepID=A0A7W9LT16_9ACTN|nr:hypothetical protein [Streptomyces caelestis]